MEETVVPKAENNEVKMLPNANICKKMSIVWDGKQFLVRFPKEVEEYLELTKEDMFQFEIDVPGLGKEKVFAGRFTIIKIDEDAGTDQWKEQQDKDKKAQDGRSDSWRENHA